jgi:very-short-patch-repair endonuclease
MSINYRWWISITVIIVVIVILIVLVSGLSMEVRRLRSKMVKEEAKAGKFCSKGETECRRVLEKYYGVPFPNQRPSWLKNPKTNRSLELDCYNADLDVGKGWRLAVEYDGEQHFKKTSMGDDKKVKELQARDKLKDKLCKENKVILIRVPYTVKNEDIEAYLMERIPRKSSGCILL